MRTRSALRSLLVLLQLLALCGASFAERGVRVSGSASVYPVLLAMAEEFTIEHPATPVSVGFSGTGGGLSRLCAGALDIAAASRVIIESELAACDANGLQLLELPVAADAITVVVSPGIEFVDCLSLSELERIWRPASSVARWSDVRPGFPPEPITLFGPGTDSGTFDYFTLAVTGEVGAVRTDFFPSEDDNVLVRGVEGSPHALAYFGYAFYALNQGRVRALAVDAGSGCVLPSSGSIATNEYAPFSRPLLIYVSLRALAENPAVERFVEFILASENRALIEGTGLVPLRESVYGAAAERLERRVAGSAFMGFTPGDDPLEALGRTAP